MTRAERRRNQAAPPPASTWWVPLALVVAGLIVYSNTFSGVFLFDDIGTIVRNAQIRDLTHLGQILLPPADTPVTGRPLVHLSLAINYALSGADASSYHAVNLGLHLGSAVLIYLLIRRTASQALAFAVALLWTVHPLNSEVVDYLTQRTESMMALCFLATLYAAARDWRVTAVLTCVAGMFCKETMAMAPIAVVLYEWAFGGDAGFRAMFQRRWRLYASLAATWVIPIVMLASRGQTMSGGFATAVTDPWMYLLNQPAMILRYLRLVVWPSDLVLVYGWTKALTFAEVWPQFVIVSILVVASIVALVKWRRVGALTVWVFLLLGPTSSVIPIATEVGAERRMYLPLIGLITLAVMGVAWIARRLGPQMKTLPAAFVAIAAVALGATTYARTAEYATSLGMANTVLARWPTPNAHQLVGTELLVVGRSQEALPHLRIAAEGYAPARYFLAQALFNLRNYDEAIAEFERLSREEPGIAPVPTRMQIAKAYGASGRMSQAAEHLKRVLAAEPNNAEAHGFLAEALVAERAYAEAVPHYQTFLESNKGSVAGWTGLGIAFAALDKPAEARPALEQALAIDPSYAPAITALKQLPIR